jgi:hypothetical protein
MDATNWLASWRLLAYNINLRRSQVPDQQHPATVSIGLSWLIIIIERVVEVKDKAERHKIRFEAKIAIQLEDNSALTWIS